MTLTVIITLTLASIRTVIAFIESEKTRKLTCNFLMVAHDSKTIRKIYYVLTLLLVLLGLLYAFLIAVLKINQGGLTLGISTFLIMACAMIAFAFTSYKVVQ